MRVLMVTPGFSPIKGGTETVVRNLSLELNKIGVDADVMTFNMNRKWNPKWNGMTEQIDGISVFKVPALINMQREMLDILKKLRDKLL